MSQSKSSMALVGWHKLSYVKNLKRSNPTPSRCRSRARDYGYLTVQAKSARICIVMPVDDSGARTQPGLNSCIHRKPSEQHHTRAFTDIGSELSIRQKSSNDLVSTPGLNAGIVSSRSCKANSTRFRGPAPRVPARPQR